VEGFYRVYLLGYLLLAAMIAAFGAIIWKLATVWMQWQLAVALVLCAAGALPAVLLMKMSIVSAVVGTLAAVIFIAFWFRPDRAPSSTRWAAIAAGLCGLAFLGLIVLRHIDWPAQPDDLPMELHEVLGVEGAQAVRFYAYDLGGFLDREWLWRIDAKPELIAKVVAGLALHRTDAVPLAFWRVAPHYWPGSLPAGAEAFQSQWFSGDGRGIDGAHYFLLHDKMRQRAFVWFKNNF